MNKNKEQIQEGKPLSQVIIENLSLLVQKFPQKKSVINAYYNYFQSQKFENNDQILNNFIWFLDMHFIDQIAHQVLFAQEENQNFLSLYGRDRNHRNLGRRFKLDNRVKWKQTWKNHSTLIDPSLFEYLEKKPWYHVHRVDTSNYQNIKTKTGLNVFYFSQAISLEHFVALHTFRPKWNFILIGKVDVWSGLFVEFEKSNQNNSWWEKYPELLQNIRENQYKPLNLPDIQTIIKARLMLTGNIFWNYQAEITPWADFQSFTKKQVEDILFQSDSKKSARLFDLKTNVSWEKKDTFLQKHTAHYTRYFHDELWGTPEVFLTNSGVSGTYSITSYLEDTVSNFDLWHEYDFYYENVQKFLSKKTSLHKDTQVFLVSPSILSPKRWVSKELFLDTLKRELDIFIANASSQPEKTFYLVIDVTTNLNLQLSDLIHSPIPPNLVVAKSYSLSKHQRGDTKYFMWWLALYGNHPEVKAWIKTTIAQNGFSLSHEQILHCPRVRKTEIQKNIETIEKNRDAFKKGFLTQIEKLNITQFVPEIIDSEYFSFLLVPIPEILYFLKHNTFPREWLSDLKDVELQFIEYGKVIEKHPLWYVRDLIPSFLYYEILKYAQVDLRDSFWLKRNNISSHYKDLGLLFLPFWETPQYKSLELPRVSFWIKKDIRHSYKLWVGFAKSYYTWLEKIITHPYTHKKTS